MIALSDPNYLTPEQYLEIETKNTIKHEYINSEIYVNLV
ncbi:hypothetical protein PL9631_1070004 [Planktothrix paucivesiculata PCC 9631]|uniref:Uncharacterized protein n=1 Tax=Planktothrix paucivesiculata PCC 9631 TaxID=671071 RepID=A0A7Z9DYR1_9CYAN|nr:hypothetical protein PL9631_1070004 [Planktothrix paucivesiculata PCC 9631]